MRLGSRGVDIPDILLLEILRTCLDETDQKFLQLKQDQNPALSFSAFWQMLQNMYDKESQAQNRLAWEAVRLPPGDLTLERWLAFLMDFQIKRDRVEDHTPQEEYQLLLRNLPPAVATRNCHSGNPQS